MTDNIINGSLSDHPAQGDYTTWQDQLDYGRGIGAQAIGEPYSWYRLNGGTGTNVIDAKNLLQSNFPIRRRKPSGSFFLETGKSAIFWYELLADMSIAVVGDVFILNDPVYGAGSTSVSFPTDQFVGFVLATHPVLNKLVAARVDRQIQVYRAPVVPDATGYMNQTFDNGQPVQLVNGTFQLGAVGLTAAFIPAGFQEDRKFRGRIVAGLDDQTAQTFWSIYVGPMPGFTFREADIIVSQEGDRYRVVNPYFQQSGASGSQLICQREVQQSIA